LSADLKRFKSLTMGHHIIMGRKTFESLGRPLKGRYSIVLTQQTSYPPPADVEVAHSLDQAIRLTVPDYEPFVIGGSQVFRIALERVDRMYVTWVEADVVGDTSFPQVDWTQWNKVSQEHHAADEKNEYDTTFCIYDRKSPQGQ
jgi:dihydrofolate reductase